MPARFLHGVNNPASRLAVRFLYVVDCEAFDLVECVPGLQPSQRPLTTGVNHIAYHEITVARPSGYRWLQRWEGSEGSLLSSSVW